MTISIQSHPPEVKECTDCGTVYEQTVYYVSKDEDPWCVVWLEKHKHHDAKAIFVTTTFGGWSKSKETSDKVTFSARYGYGIEDQFTPAFSLIREPRNEMIFGKRLDREQALKHPLIDNFWYVIDEIWKIYPKIVEWVNI